MAKAPVAGIVDREPGQRASSQGADAIQPLDTKAAAAAFSEMLTEVDPVTRQPVADVDTAPAAEPASPASAPAAAPAPSRPLTDEEWDRLEAARPDLAPDIKVARAIDERQRAALAAHQDFLQHQAELLWERAPAAFTDPGVRQEMYAVGAEWGYSQQEIEAVTDHRPLVLLYQEAMKRRGAQQAAAPAPTPASPPDDRRQRHEPAADAEYQRAARRLAKTGRLRDSAAVMATFVKEVEK